MGIYPSANYVISPESAELPFIGILKVKRYSAEIYHKIFQEWTDESRQKGKQPLSELLGLLFAHFEKYRDFYRLLNERNLVYLLKEFIIGLCGPKPEHSKVEAYARAYVAYTLYGWIRSMVSKRNAGNRRGNSRNV